MHGTVGSKPEATLRESISQVYEEGVLSLFWQSAQAGGPKEEDRSPLPLSLWHHSLSPLQQWPKSSSIEPCTGSITPPVHHSAYSRRSWRSEHHVPPWWALLMWGSSRGTEMGCVQRHWLRSQKSPCADLLGQRQTYPGPVRSPIAHKPSCRLLLS